VRSSSEKALKAEVDNWKYAFKTDNTFYLLILFLRLNLWDSSTNKLYVGGQTYYRKADRNLKKIVSPEEEGHWGQ